MCLEKVIQAHGVVSAINIGLFESLLSKKKLIDFFFYFQSSIFDSLELDFLICFDIDFMRLLPSHILDHELKMLIIINLGRYNVLPS